MLDNVSSDIFVVTRPISHQNRRIRTRTSSLLSNSSNLSFQSILEISKSHSTSGISQHPNMHEAYGSFIPVRSAACTLQDFASCITPPITRAIKRRRKVTFDVKCTYSPSWNDDSASSSSSSSSSGIPCITRTSYFAPPSPTTSGSSSPLTSMEDTRTDELHPILAKLEKRSRFCSQLVQCSTCNKKGSDFPRCPKCGEMWCSRSCRLVGGKRHVCSGQS